jgi:hypothetical protein
MTDKQIYQKEYYERNKEKKRKYYLDNKDKIRKKSADWMRNNKAKRNKIMARYNKKRRELDLVFKVKTNMRTRLYKFFKSKSLKKNKRTEELLKASYEEVMNHLKNLFTEGMTWDNYGEWHVDHIIPLASAKNIEESISLCNYKNLQPLWAIDNLLKSAKI